MSKPKAEPTPDLTEEQVIEEQKLADKIAHWMCEILDEGTADDYLGEATDLARKLYPEIRVLERAAREEAIQAVIDWLQDNIDNQDKRSAGLPSLKAIEKTVLQTVVNALKEYLALKSELLGE